MTQAERDAIRSHAKQVAAQMPPLTPEQVQAIRAIVQGARRVVGNV
jgi:hypothetical protein